VTGITVLVNASEPMLDALMTATLVLWVMSTVRHAIVAGQSGSASEPGTSPARTSEPLDKAA
jgi:hypothetical protein